MAAKFTNAVIAITAAGVKVYQAPTGTQSVLHGIFVSNNDSTNKLQHSLIITHQNASGVNTVIARDIPIPYGRDLVFPKAINLNPGESLWMTADLDGVMVAFTSVLEKS